jgi:hypothetical protein
VADIEKIRLDMRIRAIEGIVTTLLTLHCLEAAPRDPIEAFATMRQNLAKTMQEWVFPELDPAMSDLYAAELADALSLLLTRVESQIKELKQFLDNQSR